MPALPCPFGARCKDGPDGGVWVTIDIPFAEAKMLLDDHVKICHSNSENSNMNGEKIIETNKDKKNKAEKQTTR